MFYYGLLNTDTPAFGRLTITYLLYPFWMLSRGPVKNDGTEREREREREKEREREREREREESLKSI